MLSNDNRLQLYHDWIKCDGHCFRHFFCHFDSADGQTPFPPVGEQWVPHWKNWWTRKPYQLRNQLLTYQKKCPSTVFSRWWFQLFFYFHPYLGKISNLTTIFSDGLVQPPTTFPVPRVWTFSDFVTRRERNPQMRLPPWRPRRFRSANLCGGTSCRVSCYGMKLWGVFSNKKTVFFKHVCLSVYFFNIAPQKKEEKGVLRCEKQIYIFSLKFDHSTCEEWLYRNIIPALLPALEAPNQEL